MVDRLRQKKSKAYLRFLTNDPLHLLKRLKERRRTLLQPLRYTIKLLPVQRITRIALLWRIDLHLHQTLAHDRRTQHDGDELINLGLDLLVETNELEVSTAVPAFAHHAFRDAVQGREFHVVEFARLLLLQVAEALFERGEFADEDVGLVYLVREHDQLFFRRKFDHATDVLRG